MWKRRRRKVADLESRLSNAELSLKALALLVSEEIVELDELELKVKQLQQ